MAIKTRFHGDVSLRRCGKIQFLQLGDLIVRLDTGDSCRLMDLLGSNTSKFWAEADAVIIDNGPSIMVAVYGRNGLRVYGCEVKKQ